MQTINVIGCGNVGKTLARLWAQNQVFVVGSVLNRSLKSSQRAVEFVGAGQAIDDFAQMKAADLFLISASDDSIEACGRALCEAGLVKRDSVVFHCSGSLPSALLHPAQAMGAHVASVHPVKSFADPNEAAQSFRGTFCAIEGDAPACDRLRPAFEALGAALFDVEPRHKTIYHAATVFACNYLVALMETSYRCFQQAGIPRDTAATILKPIVTGTIDNVFRYGPARALTGPIARGEATLVQEQCAQLGLWDQRLQRLYQELGRVALDLSVVQGHAPGEALDAIRQALKGEGVTG